MNSRRKKFFSYYRPYLGLLSADLACAFVVSAATLALPLCASYITKNVLAGLKPNALGQIYALGGLMLGLVGLHTVCNLFVDYQGHLMGTRMESDMRRELLEHYQKLSFSFYDGQRTGQLMTRITNDLFAISELCHHGPEDLAIAVLKLAGVLIILFSINLQLSLIILLLLPVMAAYAFYFNRRMNAAVRQSRDRIGDINAQVEDTLAGIRVVKSFTNEAVEQRKFAAANSRFVDSRREGYKSEAYFSAGMHAGTQLMTIAVIVLGGAAIARAALGLADLVTYLLCVGILIEPIERLVNFARLYQEGSTGFDRFMEILEVEPDIQDAAGAHELRAAGGRIEFRGVSFRYREEHANVLRDISLDIRPGETIAFVGASGVGKTTLCSLIPRFYEVSEGEIWIDGQNIKEVSLRSLRSSIGLVQQDTYLFAGTVLENIGYGRLEASRAAIIEAATQAHAHDFIMALPNGYDTDIGQRGVKLSGGQKQRLSIARVFLKDPPILILDEATSALDIESERAVQSSLQQLARSRTTLVIAHRVSTIRNADRIVVLTDNGIEEVGSAEELMALNGAFASIYRLQGGG
ncbi:MAG: ABC transporter ATP-binding protein [Anaerolineales bacterium]